MKTTVALARCGSYERAALDSALNSVMASLGGSALFIKPGAKVLIKPNLLTDAEPARAITTHPEIVRSLIRLVRRAGAEPIIGDSNASATKLKQVWERTGFRAMCDEESVPLIGFEDAGSEGFDIAGMRFSVAKPVLEADLMINAPKLKTHMLTVLTNAVKNVYGVLPGYQKTMLHKRYSHPDKFSEFLAVLYAQVKPCLTICDAVIGMDGDGPSAGNPISLGFVGGSADGVALDATMCALLKIPIRKVPYFKYLKRLGAGETDYRRVQIAGLDRDDLSLPAFRLPSSWPRKLIPERLVALIRPFVWIRPSFNERCNSCGTCVAACPMFALEIQNGSRPILSAEKCIECFCCHEVCPRNAVTMKRSPLVNLFFRRRFPE